MRYQIEGRDEKGHWSWCNISADAVEANTLFDTEADAVEAASQLASIYECELADHDDDESDTYDGLRVIEREGGAL